MKKSHYIAIAAATLLISSTAWAGALTIPNTFTAGTPAVAADVNANFAAGKTAVDDNNTRINSVIASASTNATNITANTASAASNATNITANTGSATTNTTDIAANVTNITTLQNAKAGYATAIGVANNFNTQIPMTGTGQAVVTLTMNAPANGFAIVTGRAFASFNHTLNAVDVIGIKVSATTGDIAGDYDGSWAQIRAAQPTDTYGITMSASTVIPVVAGANTIYLNAYAPAGTGNTLLQPKLTAIYVPNAY